MCVHVVYTLQYFLWCCCYCCRCCYCYCFGCCCLCYFSALFHVHSLICLICFAHANYGTTAITLLYVNFQPFCLFRVFVFQVKIVNKPRKSCALRFQKISVSFGYVDSHFYKKMPREQVDSHFFFKANCAFSG